MQKNCFHLPTAAFNQQKKFFKRLKKTKNTSFNTTMTTYDNKDK